MIIQVKLNPKPWSFKWQLWDLKGVEDISHELEKWQLKKLKTWKFLTGYDHKHVDMMKHYRYNTDIFIK